MQKIPWPTATCQCPMPTIRFVHTRILPTPHPLIQQDACNCSLQATCNVLDRLSSRRTNTWNLGFDNEPKVYPRRHHRPQQWADWTKKVTKRCQLYYGRSTPTVYLLALSHATVALQPHDDREYASRSPQTTQTLWLIAMVLSFAVCTDGRRKWRNYEASHLHWFFV